MSQPRRHHFVPQFYLAGFTRSGKRSDMLYVLDLNDGRQWRSSPGNTACEKDFYMLEFDGDDAYAVERAFAHIEGQASDPLRTIRQDKAVPDGDDYVKLIAFLAAMCVRVPGILHQMDSFHDRIMKSVAWYLTADKRTWEAHVERMRSDGQAVPDIPWEEMRRFAQSGDYTVRLDQNSRMCGILTMLEPATALLAERNWSVVQASDNTHGFVCSDRPLSLCWNDPSGKGCLPPGLGLKETSVMCPVSQDTALVGVFEPRLPPRTLDNKGVGIFNMWAAVYAERSIYSREDDFDVTLPDGSLGGKNELLEYRKKKPNV